MRRSRESVAPRKLRRGKRRARFHEHRPARNDRLHPRLGLLEDFPLRKDLRVSVADCNDAFALRVFRSRPHAARTGHESDRLKFFREVVGVDGNDCLVLLREVADSQSPLRLRRGDHAHRIAGQIDTRDMHVHRVLHVVAIVHAIGNARPVLSKKRKREKKEKYATAKSASHARGVSKRETKPSPRSCGAAAASAADCRESPAPEAGAAPQEPCGASTTNHFCFLLSAFFAGTSNAEMSTR